MNTNIYNYKNHLDKKLDYKWVRNDIEEHIINTYKLNYLDLLSWAVNKIVPDNEDNYGYYLEYCFFNKIDIVRKVFELYNKNVNKYKFMLISNKSNYKDKLPEELWIMISKYF